MNLQIAVQIGTLVSVILGVYGLYKGIQNYKRQANAQIFLAYTERYEKIMETFPSEALFARLSLDGKPPEPNEKLTIAVLRYLNLCSEEFYLCNRKYLAGC